MLLLQVNSILPIEHWHVTLVGDDEVCGLWNDASFNTVVHSVVDVRNSTGHFLVLVHYLDVSKVSDLHLSARGIVNIYHYLNVRISQNYYLIIKRMLSI